jgi:hypothetical protein
MLAFKKIQESTRGIFQVQDIQINKMCEVLAVVVKV